MSSGRPFRILLTGFEPFGDVGINASERLVSSLAAEPPPGVDLVTEILPTVFAASAERVKSLLGEESFDAYLALGVGESATALRLERLALNRQDARIPDNAGVQPRGEPVVAGGPAAYLTTLPTEGMREAMEAAGIPTVISHSAGSFVCNHVFYRALWESARAGRHLPIGFVHVPHVPEEAARRETPTPSMPLAKMRRGVEVAIEAVRATIA